MAKNKLEALVASQVANAISTVKEATPKSTTSKKAASAKKTVTNPTKEDTTPAPAQDTKKKISLKKKKTTKEEVIQEAATQQKASIMEEVVSHRDVKYIYPDDVQDTLARKKWRQTTRNELRRLEREMYRIQDTNSKEFKAAKKAFEDYRKKVLKPEQVA